MPSRKRNVIPEDAGVPPRLKNDGYLTETALCVSGRYPKKADKGGEEDCSSSPRRSASQEREGRHIAIVRCGHQRPEPKKGWRMAAGGKEKQEKKREEKKEVPVPSAQESKTKGKLSRRSPAARSGDAIGVSAKDGESYAEIL